MPHDFNGYNSAFKTFVKFARHRSKAGLEGDVANATVTIVLDADLNPGIHQAKALPKCHSPRR